MQHQISLLQEQIERLRESVRETRDELDEAKKKKRETKERLIEATKEREEFLRETDELRDQLTSLQQVHNQKLSELEERLRNQEIEATPTEERPVNTGNEGNGAALALSDYVVDVLSFVYLQSWKL